MSATRSPVLFRRECHQFRQFIWFAAVMFVPTAPFLGGMMTEMLPLIWPLVYLPALIVLVAAMLDADLNSGLLVSALNTVVIAGVMVFTHATRAVLSPSWPFTGWSWYLWVAVALLGIGIGAFILGSGVRRSVTYSG